MQAFGANPNMQHTPQGEQPGTCFGGSADFTGTTFIFHHDFLSIIEVLAVRSSVPGGKRIGGELCIRAWLATQELCHPGHVGSTRSHAV